MVNCAHCNTDITLNYCPQCGQSAKLKRIDGHYIQHEILHILHFEKGILYTVKELLLRPGKSIRLFIAENRDRLVKPIVFIIISSLLYTIVNHTFHIEEGYFHIEDMKGSSTNAMNEWVQSHYGYSNIIIGVFIALWLKLFFRNSGYNFFEILILLCFVIGMGMLIFTVFAVVEGLTKLKVLPVSGVVYFIYSTWAVGQFFNAKKIGGYAKAFAAYLLGLLTVSLITLIIGISIDLLIKH
ncbi:hypothetical protein GCM10023149_31990 [Mucilaginibacter gynuensis]|uniref:DUF3667 domain-containing protein n=1 Tax=Mucilaginibacter gynuensis TaxID=1302236 RepID=A0ABP8GQJ2_9SPHI